MGNQLSHFDIGYHRAIMTYGYPRVLSSVAKQVLHTGKIICGVGIVENGYAETARIRVLGADEIINEEKALLEEARRLPPALPFEDVDVLIIDEMGKDISGTGFDTKLIRIKNTQELGVMEISSAYREEIAERTDLEMLSGARAMRFDRDGNLPPITC